MRCLIVLSLIAFAGVQSSRIMKAALRPSAGQAVLADNTVQETYANAARAHLHNLGKPEGEFERRQAETARYAFSTNIDDQISDLTQSRKEVRDGLKVQGMYSYSDGYTKRTVHYEADENGYRVTGEEAEPLDGPHIDLTGTASVDSDAHGRHISYRVQSVPVPGPVPKILNDIIELK